MPRPLSEGVETRSGDVFALGLPLLLLVLVSVSDDGRGQTSWVDSIKALRTKAEPVSRWQVVQ